MIGAHDIFTYLDAEDFALNIFAPFWRCQQYSPNVLYNKYGVRFFDIRVCRNKTASIVGIFGKLFKKKKFTWATAHGLAEFNQNFNTIEDVFKYMNKNFPEAQYRIVLERCSTDEKNEFYNQIKSWIANNGSKLKASNYKCSWIGIKKPWTQLYIDSNLYPKNIKDYSCRLFNWDPSKSLSANIKNFRADYTIETWAKRNNPKLTISEKNDTNTLYFMDYVGKYGIKNCLQYNN